jgi:hypothetical protein
VSQLQDVPFQGAVPELTADLVGRLLPILCAAMGHVAAQEYSMLCEKRQGRVADCFSVVSEKKSGPASSKGYPQVALQSCPNGCGRNNLHHLEVTFMHLMRHPAAHLRMLPVREGEGRCHLALCLTDQHLDVACMRYAACLLPGGWLWLW